MWDFHDESDPLVRSIRRIGRFLRNALLVALVVGGMLLAAGGVPAVQGNYRARPVSGTPTAHDKIDADYWIPLVGWRVVRAGEFAPGCPTIIFIPISQCLEADEHERQYQ